MQAKFALEAIQKGEDESMLEPLLKTDYLDLLYLKMAIEREIPFYKSYS